MKSSKNIRSLFVVLAVFIVTSFGRVALAKTEMPVVLNYQYSGQASAWKKVNKSEVPLSLVSNVEIENPSRAYASPYARVFLQNENAVVCYQSCKGKQLFSPTLKGDDYKLSLNAKDGGASLRMTTVYYWVNALFARLEKMGYKPNKQLRILVDRNVSDPGSGVRSSNNAFFNGSDWTLSFLPSESSFLYKVMGMKMGPSGNDPSVALHEATHSVFEDVLGPFLNSEVLGLHEAFADYFAMVLLNDPAIGKVMMRGQVLRTAEPTKPIKYTPGMEAHDLGNVVVAALWKIRKLYSDEELADKIALETIKYLSRDVYASAGDISVAYDHALLEFGMTELMNNPNLKLNAENIWAEKSLLSRKVEATLAVIAPPYSTVSRVGVVTRLSVSDEMVREFGMEKETATQLTLLEVRSEPKNEVLKWLRVSVSDGGFRSETPFWILMNVSSGAIEHCVTLDGRPMEREDSLEFRRLLALRDNIQDIFEEFSKGLGLEAIQLMTEKSSLIRKSKVKAYRGPELTINGKSVQSTELRVGLSPSLLGKFLGGLAGSELKAMTKGYKEVSVFVVDKNTLKPSGPIKLISDGSDNIVVGYRVLTGGGLIMELTLAEYQ
jgi:hypothetical protein